MEEHDDWKLGDEGDPTVCPGCGKRNRAGLKDCIICGRSLVDDDETGSDALRTIGEAMGGRASRARQPPPRRSLRAWSIALALLLGVVVVLTWLQTREEPFRLEDWTGTPEPTMPPVVATATAVATPVVTPTPRPRPTVVATVVVVVEPTVLPPEPTVVRPVTTPTRRPPPPPKKKSRAVVVPPPPPVVVEPDDEPTPVDRPRSAATEKPSLGSDLQEATREYRQAVDVHNSRVDEYNAVADEIQRRNAWDDSEASLALRRRLDRAREGVESARVQAELLRARMESVRARYR